jgi:hypothetical protein
MKKTQGIKITQKDGIINIIRLDEVEAIYRINDVVERIKDGKMSSTALANMIAEIMHDCLNCKKAVATLEDLNDTKSYRGTYFEDIDQFTD